MATKKIIDILPPKRGERTGKKSDEGRKSAAPAKKAVVSAVKENIGKSKTRKESRFRIPAGLKDFKLSFPRLSAKAVKSKAFLLLPLLFLFGMYFISALSATANVEIWPKMEDLTINVKINADKKIRQFNISENSIPAEVIEKEKTVSGSFAASGKISKETKAEGVITVYNNYSPSYQVLVATTRFVSTEGKVFRAKERVMVPGTTNEGGKLKAGEINIRVVADGPGEEYNIGPDTFSIPGFAGTDRYTKFYAKSFQPFSGGALEKVSQVTAADINKAEDSLTQQAKAEAEALLKNELMAENVSSVFNFLESDIQTEIVEKFSSVKPGGETDEFTSQVKAKSKTLIFKKEDMEKFAKNYIAAKTPEGKKIHEPSLGINYSAESVSFASGSAALAVEISADIYSDVDEEAIKNSVSQKSLSEIKLFLSNQPEIENVLVKMWPFWLAKAPKDANRINIKLNFNAR